MRLSMMAAGLPWSCVYFPPAELSSEDDRGLIKYQAGTCAIPCSSSGLTRNQAPALAQELIRLGTRALRPQICICACKPG